MSVLIRMHWCFFGAAGDLADKKIFYGIAVCPSRVCRRSVANRRFSVEGEYFDLRILGRYLGRVCNRPKKLHRPEGWQRPFLPSVLHSR